MCLMKLNKILSYIEEFKQSTRLFIQQFLYFFIFIFLCFYIFNFLCIYIFTILCFYIFYFYIFIYWVQVILFKLIFHNFIFLTILLKNKKSRYSFWYFHFFELLKNKLMYNNNYIQLILKNFAKVLADPKRILLHQSNF